MAKRTTRKEQSTRTKEPQDPALRPPRRTRGGGQAPQCRLVDQETGEPIDSAAIEHEQEGEVRLLAAGISKENVQSARRDAIEKARAHFMELYACDGRCDKKDAFCALGVEIKRDRTGRVKTRTIQLGPGDALYDRTGVSSVVQRYLTHKIFCAPACGCVEPDPLPSQGEGNVEQYDASYGGVIVTFGD